MNDESKSLGILLGIKPRRAESHSRYDPRIAAVRRLRAAFKNDADDTEVIKALREWESVKDLGDDEDSED